MLSHDQLAFAVSKLHPALIHGKDFWAAHPVEGDKQLAEAEILDWKASDTPQPDIETLRETFGQHAAEWHAHENRRKRDARLFVSDWTQTPDLPAAFRKRWAEYRKQLRELPQTKGFPLSVDWPKSPDERLSDDTP